MEKGNRGSKKAISHEETIGYTAANREKPPSVLHGGYKTRKKVGRKGKEGGGRERERNEGKVSRNRGRPRVRKSDYTYGRWMEARKSGMASSKPVVSSL